MSWIQKLYETYENCQSMIGESQNDNVPLLPICHTTQKAQIEIAIDGKGNFRRAYVVPREKSRTIIPCTENSGGRTSGPVAHPLCDKLQYIARDYSMYGGNKTSFFDLYLVELDKWCRSDYSHPKIGAILKYVKKGRVVRDLIDSDILFVSKNGKLLSKSDYKKEGKNLLIWDVLNSQEEAFVRWIVEIPGDRESKVWKDKSLWKKWILYYSSTKSSKSLCYVTGIEDFSAAQHPAKLRNDGDKAKLISSNDLSGFTFRGRFQTSDQAGSVGFKTSQRAHYALRWLIARQGYRKGDQAIVAWATSGVEIPKPTDDSWSIMGSSERPSDELSISSTAQELAIKLKKKIAGYNAKLGDTDDVVVMGLDSATPGRMAITYYRELKGSDFLLRINNWHETCSWAHNYRHMETDGKKSDKKGRISIPFVGAPAPSDIAEAAYGRHLDDRLRKATVERMLPCIIDEQVIPRDIVESVIRRASNRSGLEKWDWEKTLSIACALYRKHNRKEDYDMALDPNRKTRDYLFGRLLALADSLEGWALSIAGENRETNAARLMQRFSERPYTTWRTIELALAPYKARLGGKSKKRQKMIDEVVDTFEAKDFLNDKRLSGEFLLGYHSQREFLRHQHEHIDDPDIDSN